jgi:hypothetical protein
MVLHLRSSRIVPELGAKTPSCSFRDFLCRRATQALGSDVAGAVGGARLGNLFHAVLGSRAMSNGKKEAGQGWPFLPRWPAILPMRVLPVRQRQIGQRLFMVTPR